MTMKPFLLLTTRDNDEAAAGEFDAVKKFGQLADSELVQFRLDQDPLPDLNLDDYSGIILGGSGFCVSDPAKDANQLRVEADLARLLDAVFARDFPFLGMCFGIGMVTSHLGGEVGHENSEDVGAITVTLTDEGKQDPLLAGSPAQFQAFVGHKEGAASVPADGVLLGTGDIAKVQLFRVGKNVYACQYHPELDAEALVTRMGIYKHAGYFAPEELDDIAKAARDAGLDGSQHLLLSNFVKRYRA
jgi:GMP synthase (glutamine-hydrolysing)